MINNSKYDVTCIGLLNPSFIADVKEHSSDGSHAFYTNQRWTIATDAVIVAATLAFWDQNVFLISNSLGEDCIGKEYIDMLKKYGIKSDFKLSKNHVTPLEFIFVNSNDNRKWYSEEESKLYNSLIESNLNTLIDSRFAYTDWYTREVAIKVYEIAQQKNIPVLINLGRTGYEKKLDYFSGKGSFYFQLHLSENSNIEEVIKIAKNVYSKTQGQQIIATLGKKGSIVIYDNEAFFVETPQVNAVDTNGAGATFSAALIYSMINGFSFFEGLKYSSTAAALKCKSQGIIKLKPSEILDQMHASNLQIIKKEA